MKAMLLLSYHAEFGKNKRIARQTNTAIHPDRQADRQTDRQAGR